MRITIISLMLALLAVGCSKKESANTATQSSLSQGIYTNSVLGVSAKKVAGWTLIFEAERESRIKTTTLNGGGLQAFILAHMSKPFLIITKPREISPQPAITALVAPLGSMMSTDAAANLQRMTASGKRAFEDYRIVEEPHSIEIGGRKGAYCKAIYTLHFQSGESAPVCFETWHIVRGDHYFLIGVVSRQPEDEGTEKEIKQIIASFKIDEVGAK